MRFPDIGKNMQGLLTIVIALLVLFFLGLAVNAIADIIDPDDK